MIEEIDQSVGSSSLERVSKHIAYGYPHFHLTMCSFITSVHLERMENVHSFRAF